MDKMQNFVVGDIVTAPSPASSGTAIEVESNENFPNPSTFGAYNLVLWNKEGIPDTSNCEIVRVTSISVVNSTLTELTITRAQEGTTAKTITTSWRAYLSPTKKYFDDLKTYIDGLQLTKASGSDINTGTDDVKYVTSKAIADSKVTITDKVQTLTNKTLTSPKINEDVALTATATQLNAVVATKSRVRVYNNSTQVIPGDGTFAKIAFNTENFDVNSEFNTSTYVFTAKRAGYYLASLNAMFQTSGFRIVAQIRLNNARYGESTIESIASYSTLNVNNIIPLAVNDTIAFYINQTSGSNKTFQSDSSAVYAYITEL